MDKEKLIQGYFIDTLSSDELEEVQRLLEIDPVFREEVEQYENVQQVLKEKERLHLKNRLQDLEAQPEKKRGTPQLWLIAASIFVLLGVGGFFIFNQGVDSQELYASNFEVYPNTLQPVVRGDIGTEMAPFIAYEAGRYKEATTGFLELLENGEQPDLRFYYAMSLLNTDDQSAEASVQLWALEDSGTKYLPQVLWYQGLIQLQNENIEVAKEQFTKLLEHPAKYKNREAEEILKNLD